MLTYFLVKLCHTGENAVKVSHFVLVNQEGSHLIALKYTFYFA